MKKYCLWLPSFPTPTPRKLKIKRIKMRYPWWKFEIYTIMLRRDFNFFQTFLCRQLTTPPTKGITYVKTNEMLENVFFEVSLQWSFDRLFPRRSLDWMKSIYQGSKSAEDEIWDFLVFPFIRSGNLQLVIYLSTLFGRYTLFCIRIYWAWENIMCGCVFWG